MIALGMSQHDPSFPPLSKEDTYRKPTHLKRVIGDSRRNDGALWSAGITGGVSHVVDPKPVTGAGQSLIVNPPVVTQAVHRKRKKFTYTQMMIVDNLTYIKVELPCPKE